jgi:hypothetical protein
MGCCVYILGLCVAGLDAAVAGLDVLVLLNFLCGWLGDRDVLLLLRRMGDVVVLLLLLGCWAGRGAWEGCVGRPGAGSLMLDALFGAGGVTDGLAGRLLREAWSWARKRLAKMGLWRWRDYW